MIAMPDSRKPSAEAALSAYPVMKRTFQPGPVGSCRVDHLAAVEPRKANIRYDKVHNGFTCQLLKSARSVDGASDGIACFHEDTDDKRTHCFFVIDNQYPLAPNRVRLYGQNGIDFYDVAWSIGKLDTDGRSFADPAFNHRFAAGLPRKPVDHGEPEPRTPCR